MICVYNKNNTDFTKNGDAVLMPTSATLEMTINGTWQLKLSHPYDPEGRYKLLVEGNIIRADITCIRELETIRQLFRIYYFMRDTSAVEVIAFPVAMEANFDAPIDNIVIENKTGIEAMAALQNKIGSGKYTLQTDITRTGSTSLANTNIHTALAGSGENSFLKVWGGELIYDNFKFKVRNRVGDNIAADHKIQYGNNLSNIEYKKDDSGVTTRIYPISQDGIRLNGSGYVDSPDHFSDYPVAHCRHLTAPYTLVDTNPTSPTSTAAKTRQAVAAVTAQAQTDINTGVTNATGAGIPPEYIKSIKQNITEAIKTAALSAVYSSSLYAALGAAIEAGAAGLAELEQPEWGWMGSDETGWKYGNADSYARNEYIKIGKKWSYFGDDGNWQEPRDDSAAWDWHQESGTLKRYGNFEKYYAHNEYIYITEGGTLKEYWFNEQGWYESDESGDSNWNWHGSGTAEDPWWFGEEGATASDTRKFAHDCWLFIDGTLYFFDSYGYYDGSTKFENYQWDWVESDERFWFGNDEDHSFAAVYLKSQWAKINGAWYYFDANGYVETTNDSIERAVAFFTAAITGTTSTVNSWRDQLYTLLYNNMTAWALRKYSQERVDLPVITISVFTVDLSKTTEYKGFEHLQTIKLGDSVECTDAVHGISTTNRVVGIVYDIINDYNAEVIIGSATASVASMISGAAGQAVAGGFDSSAIETQLNTQATSIAQLRQNKQDKMNAGNLINLSGNIISADIEANPGAAGTTDLQKIRLGNTIFNLPSGGSGDGYYVGLTQAEYDALPVAEKEDTSKLYLVQQGEETVVNNYDMSSTTNVTFMRNNPMQVILESATKNYIFYETWSYLANYGCQVVYQRIDVTNYDFIKFDLKTAGNFSHRSSEVEEETSEKYQVIIGLTTQTVTATWVAENLTLLEVYKRFNKTNTNYGEIVFDVREKTGVYNLVLSAWSWELEIENLRIEKAETLDRRLYWNNRQWAKFPNALRYWIETEKKFYNTGKVEGISGNKDFIKTTTNEVGTWQNGQGWTSCIVTRVTGTPRKAVMGYSQDTTGHPIIVVAALTPLDFEWGFSNNTLYPPYDVQTWESKETYPVSQESSSFGYNTGSCQYDGATWYILLIDTTTWSGGTALSASEGLTGFNKNRENDPEAMGLALLEAAQAKSTTTVTMEIATEGDIVKYYTDEKTIIDIDADGNATVKEITTAAGSLTSQMAAKQNKLTEGDNITIDGDTISATDTKYNNFTGATAQEAGTAGLVPAPQTTESDKFLKGDGTWATPSGGGGSANIVELTQAEYDALPSSKLSDNTLYMVYFDGGQTLDPNYNYYKYGENDEIVVRVYHEGQADQEIRWYFHGYTQVAALIPIPAELGNYWSGANTAKAYTANTTTVYGWIAVTDYLGGRMGIYSTNWGAYLSGPIDAMIVIGGGAEQSTTYSDPYVYIQDNPPFTKIYYNTHEFTHKVTANPTGAATANLEKIEVDGIIYETGGRISYGTAAPTGSGKNGDLFILLDNNNNKIGEYLFITNAWAQIE